MIKYYIYLFIILIGFSTKAQDASLPEDTQISVITIGPGASLSDQFGHNAFRVKSNEAGFDVIYDYGRFDFDTPNFYLKFAQGKLLYEIGSNNFEPFYHHYRNQNRWLKEQSLNLNTTEKQAIFDFLQENIKPENRKYKYDFFFDNCATKIRDVLVDVLGNKLNYGNKYVTEDATFRQLIQKNLNANSWGSLGIDAALGAIIDRKATPWEHQFLPEYIYKAAQVATIERPDGHVDLVNRSTDLYISKPVKKDANFLLSPLFVLGILSAFIIFITLRDFQKKQRSRWLDGVIFLITGLIGLLLFLLWFATDHTATANNYNLLWAFPFNILFLGVICKKVPKAWFQRYIIFLILLLLLLSIHWMTGVQVFAIGLLPFFIALMIRYVFLAGFLRKK